MNLLLLKQISILSAFLGVFGGLVALIPPFFSWMILAAFIFPAILVLVYLKQNDLIGIINVKDGCILGAVIGAVSFLASFIVFAPISIILGIVMKLLFNINYVPGLLRLIPFDFGSIIIVLLIVIFLAFLCGMFNACWGLATAYVYELITGVKKENNENNSVDFEIK